MIVAIAIAVAVPVAVVVVLLLLMKLLLLTNKPAKIPLQDSHVMVTGGSSGIGLEIAKLCASKGAVISILARNTSKLEIAKEEIEKCSIRPEGNQCHFVSVDISNNFQKVQDAVKELTKKVGPVDMLFNCAGTSCAASFMDLAIEKFTSLMNINYLGAVYCTRAVLESMKARKKGRVVFLSSQAGQTGVYGYTAYSASKFALRGLAETLQMEDFFIHCFKIVNKTSWKEKPCYEAKVQHLNIGITISFPPDTETPGFEAENVCKPLETKLISGDGVAFKADDVAASIVDDALKGNFMNYIGLDGFILGHVSSGMAPCNSLLQCCVQFCLMGLFRVISLAYLKSFINIVRACANKKTCKRGDQDVIEDHALVNLQSH